MRHVPRDSQPLPAELLADMQAENEENIRIALDNAGKPEKEHAKFKWKLYSSGLLKPFLNRLFHGKCAYCESLYIATQPVDVEHWRPKSEVVVEPADGSKPFKVEGYYWLGADWNNLLPSCIDCNRRRYHQEYSPDATGGSQASRRRLIGKKNFFPVRPGTARAEAPGEEEDEEPLLFHPCADDNLEQAFQFEAGMAGIVIPNSRDSEIAQQMAEASIYGYALNRSGLVYARNELLLDLRERFHAIERLAELREQPPDVVPATGQSAFQLQVEELIDREMQALRRACHASRPYSLMVQQVVSRFLARLFADDPDDEEEIERRRDDILQEIRATEKRGGSLAID